MTMTTILKEMLKSSCFHFWGHFDPSTTYRLDKTTQTGVHDLHNLRGFGEKIVFYVGVKLTQVLQI